MMKKTKNILIYGIIILLCVTAFGGYLMKQIADNKTEKAEEVVSIGVEETAAEKPDIIAEVEEVVQEGSPIIKEGNNIAGRTEEQNQAHIKVVMAQATEALDPNPIVGINQGTDFAQVTEAAIANAGGLVDIVEEGDVVLIKPNLCVQSEAAGSPMTTDYRVVQQVIDMAYECGASRVIVAEGNFGSNAFTHGPNRYKELVGAELFNFNDCEEEDCYELVPENSFVGKALFVPKAFMDADVVINVAKLKTHFITKVTLGLKNSIGVPSYQIYGRAGDKSGLHSLGIEKVIIDLNKIRKPDFTIIDGIIGGEGYGPYANTPVESNTVIAGKDIVAVDTIALTFMGFELDEVSHVKDAGEEKLGISDLSAIELVGGDLEAIKMAFKPAI